MLLQSSFLLAQAFSKPESLPGGLDHPRPTGGVDLSDDVLLWSLSMMGFHPGPWPMGGADLSDEVAPPRLPMLGSDPGALPKLVSALLACLQKASTRAECTSAPSSPRSLSSTNSRTACRRAGGQGQAGREAQASQLQCCCAVPMAAAAVLCAV